ncbi:MAG: hypothetical protein GC159_07185 [Phycisphaera sp.]|nr:hypothetical protein [Phycisphaera sp.]
MTLWSATILLLLVMDPVGNTLYFTLELKRVSPERRRWVTVRELLIAFALMLAFLFAGQRFLGVLGISEPALTIAGGVVLFLIALRMVFPAVRGPYKEDIDGEPFIVPLAVPYIAGPSVLATEMLLMSREPDHWLSMLGAVVLAWVVTATVLYFGTTLSARIGQRGLIAMERLMGMILVTLSIQMLLSGIEKYIVHIRTLGA